MPGEDQQQEGHTIDSWYSGKAHCFGGNIQGLFIPAGVPLLVSPVSPGGVHGNTAAREHVPPGLRPNMRDLPVADSEYEGAGCGVHVPVNKPARSRELDVDTRTRNDLLGSMRCLGERGFALMPQRWRILHNVMISPSQIGEIAQAALVLVQFEHRVIT